MHYNGEEIIKIHDRQRPEQTRHIEEEYCFYSF